MDNSDNLFLYQSDNGGTDEQMYIIADDGSMHMDGMQSYSIADGGGENIIQIHEGDGQITDMNGDSYILYDENGQAYIVESNSSETNSDMNNNSDVNNNGKLVTYRCPSCSLSYQNANAFTKHMREKHFVKVFTCRQCEDFFENLSLLFLHARRTHVDPKKPRKNPSNFKFHCPDCDYMTNNGGTMEHHRRAHSGVKPYKCDICFKMFAQKANMKTHKNRHIHKDRIFRCDTCNKSFNSHDIYLAHLRTREHELQEHFQMIVTSKIRIRCMGCNEVFENYFYVNKHSRSCEILKSLKIKFWCIQCEAGFMNSTELKHHLKGHGGNQIITCPVCGERGFPGFNQLNHHITRAHALKVNRRNVCRYCEMTFESKELLDDHIEDMHHSEKNARQSRGAAGRLRCRYDSCDFTSNSVMLMDRHHDQHVNNSLPLTREVKARGRRRKLPPVPMIDFGDEGGKCEMGLVDVEIEHLHGQAEYNEILRGAGAAIGCCDDSDDRLYHNHQHDAGDISGRSNCAVKTEMIVSTFRKARQAPAATRESESIDDMDIDDLERLATSFVQKTTNGLSISEAERKKKRGRPRKTPVRFEDYEVSNLELSKMSRASAHSVGDGTSVKHEHYETNGWNND